MLVNTLLHRKTQNTACYVFCLHVCNILTFRNNVKLKSASSGPVLKLILWCVFVNFCCMGGRGTRLLRVLFPRLYLRVLFANSFRRFCCKYAVQELVLKRNHMTCTQKDAVQHTYKMTDLFRLRLLLDQWRLYMYRHNFFQYRFSYLCTIHLIDYQSPKNLKVKFLKKWLQQLWHYPV